MSFPVTELLFSNAKAALKQGLDNIKNGQYEFDLGNLKITDSSSIAVMLAWQRTAQTASRQMQFINVPASILSLASLYGVTGLLGLQEKTEGHTLSH